MTDLAKKATLNRVYNQLMDLLDHEGVKLAAYGYSPIPALEKDGVALSFVDATRTTAYDDSQPSSDYDAFVAGATDVFVAKDRDYQSRFMRALCDVDKDPRTIWAWEIEKKLDRIRTWAATGKLAVKGEGVKNSVQDIFVYTIQWGLYQAAHAMGINPFDILNERDFFRVATAQKPPLFLEILFEEGVLDPEEAEVCRTINKYMGVSSE